MEISTKLFDMVVASFISSVVFLFWAWRGIECVSDPKLRTGVWCVRTDG